MPLSLFVFDLAGTLIRDDGLTLGVYQRIAHEERLEAPDDWFLARMGMQKPRVLAELLRKNRRGAADVPRLVERFEHAMGSAFTESPPAILPSAQETLDALARLGVRIGFNTGFTRPTAALIVEACGWTAIDLVTSDQVASGRPAPDMIQESMRRAGLTDARAVGVCGDTPSDLLAAHHAGCGVNVGVGHGTHTLEALRPYPHTHLLGDLSRIPDIAMA